ncbi:sulfate ABC transporter permease subunit CysT [Rhodobacter sphaeroides]|jgi:sulfate transport system permease protein|uniref:Sulfate transport system permease protein CysT n=1 Tax=Cereibacter sphaeroides (strain ATCC 17023 / DSM 158 / JCM 6121 / CCUG 31486 / LMG 2827 / NBRC 12203 / NCIMB 8253 / ATH 2.4.1.) TaxID=272943 RepID=Q3HKM6_CERS4|nr:sulfate ABC transporter permease subunit CysT [Cereibacter sphaeroides]ABN79247.1 sulfate ABC transporter, inner membrane subunit CysT [Cereibacter sphaeroides ATCC 17029]ABA81718.1 ABC Sulfate/Molybdate transporter, inner membrane subunit [Cereibacter sphaeroides 2.4.1]ANS36652.1 sulfate ABC transporter permease subunit CysT [Cereibacter sphaeroides]ATN65674.1 sulfate ABC transporter permease subunit CysT [Cereibacter sphaeroides]AXC63788.1 sulfate ABC transporter permease subunit CysT [Ce
MRALRAPSPLPGFGLAMGITLTALSLVVLLPIGALLLRGAQIGPADVAALLGRERVQAALALSFRAALGAAAINLVFGLALAWVLARYRFPGRRLVDAAVDLPFALPTAVAGIALTALYAPNGAIGRLLEPLGIRVAYSEAGIWLALIFVGLPFVVRSVQPVIEEIDREVEEASATLGASRARTFGRVILPMLAPALLTGFALALARAVGEYGSVIFIAGNLPMQTEIAPLLIVIRLEEFDYDGAVAIALAMLGISFALLFAINLVQIWSRRRMGAV